MQNDAIVMIQYCLHVQQMQLLDHDHKKGNDGECVLLTMRTCGCIDLQVSIP